LAGVVEIVRYDELAECKALIHTSGKHPSESLSTRDVVITDHVSGGIDSCHNGAGGLRERDKDIGKGSPSQEEAPLRVSSSVESHNVTGVVDV